MRKLIISMAAMIVAATVIYFMGVYMSLKWNVAEWPESGRFITLLFFIVAAPLSVFAALQMFGKRDEGGQP